MSGLSTVNHAAAESISGGDPTLTELIAAGLGLIHVLQVYTSCMMTLAVWDWLVCLHMEWDRIWKREWSMVKIIYIWTRYYGLLCFSLNLWLFTSEFTSERCKTLHYLIAATCMWTTLGSETILAIRTYAFLGKKAWVGAILGTMLVVETAFLLYVSIAGVYQIQPVIGDRGPCTASDKPGKHVVSGFWLAPLGFDLICTFLTAFKSFSLKSMGVKSPIITIFLREGVFYFLAVSAVNVLNAAFMFQSNPSLQNINSFLALVLSQVLCCRLVLNLRSSPQEPPSYFTPSGSHHSFAPNTSRSTPSGISIPLKRFRDAATTSNPGYPNDVYDGVKVQIDVERQPSGPTS